MPIKTDIDCPTCGGKMLWKHLEEEVCPACDPHRLPSGLEDYAPYATTADAWEATRQWMADYREVRSELDKAIVREQALAANVQEAQKLADADRVTRIVFRDGEHPAPGWNSKLGRDLHIVLAQASTTSLSRRDPIVRAEALEDMARKFDKEIGQALDSDYHDLAEALETAVEEVRTEATLLRQQAQELTK